MHAELGHYVYQYVDPATGEPFYVGVGVGNRAFSHLKDLRRSAKTQRIRSILASGRTPRVEIVVHGLRDRATAMKVEAALIDVLGLDRLTNEVRGWEAVRYGLRDAATLRGHYARQPVDVVHPSILIKIPRLFRPDMQALELYDAVRSAWKIGKQRERAHYAMPIFNGIVQEVYRIAAWLPAGSTLASREDTADPERWEFVGTLAEAAIRKRYQFKSVAHLARGQNPITYAGF